MKSLFLIIALLILVGCASGVESEPTKPTPQQSPSLDLQLVITPTVQETATPTSLPTLTPIPTYPPIQTPPQKENEEITLEMLRTNNGCDLPCWWGMVPNQTRWSDAETFLASFSEIYERQPPSEWSVYDVNSPVSEEFSDVYAVRTVFAVQQGLVKEIEIGYFDEETYHLGELLRKYGVPTNVLVSTYSSDSGMPPNQVPLSINLYYPEKGINALYGTYATVQAEEIEGCIDQSPNIFLWSSDEHIRTIDYILGWDAANIPYMSIEEATDLDVQAFYEKYANPANSPCMQTPTNLWPSQ